MTEPTRPTPPTPPGRQALPAVEIYTDGGADPNPGPGGWGAVLLDPVSGKSRELSGGEPKATNNRMELTAAIRALEALKTRCRVRLVTDSQYVRRGITEWLAAWEARGWKRKDGELSNVDLWQRLAELSREHEIRWDWIKGHAGHKWNERADQLATAAIRALRSERATASPASPADRAEVEVFLRVARPKGKGVWAALVRRGEEETFLSGDVPEASSPNQLDILGAIAALEALPGKTSVAVHTGSDYLRHGAARWLPGWSRGGWKTKEGAAVKNRDLWQRLETQLRRLNVAWPEIKGNDLPELAELDRRLKEAAKG